MKDSARARLLNVAGELFATRGFAATSTRTLAAAAKCNVASISYHFGDKEGLYEATVDDMFQQVMAASTRVSLKGNPEQQVRQAVEVAYDLAKEHRLVIRLLLHQVIFLYHTYLNMKE